MRCAAACKQPETVLGRLAQSNSNWPTWDSEEGTGQAESKEGRKSSSKCSPITQQNQEVSTRSQGKQHLPVLPSCCQHCWQLLVQMLQGQVPV
jgi:hypothetical protein